MRTIIHFGGGCAIQNSNQLIMLPFAGALAFHRASAHRPDTSLGTLLSSRVRFFSQPSQPEHYLFGIRQPERILHEVGRIYIHFMALVGSLFVVVRRITHYRFAGEAHSIFVIAVLLFLGTIAGSVLGTVGASMLFIRPWIRVNKYRYTGLHTAFFIFLVSNLGGGLTPMGPPLFLGYLKGVPFWWVVQSLLAGLVRRATESASDILSRRST